jgi:hypothetical protein
LAPRPILADPQPDAAKAGSSIVFAIVATCRSRRQCRFPFRVARALA